MQSTFPNNMNFWIFFLGIVLAIVSGTASSQSVPSNVPTNGLVGWWPFNGNAHDASGNGNHGTVNGATPTTDRFGNPNCAFDFDGLSNNISLSNIYFVNAITIAYWIHIPPNGGGMAVVQNMPSYPYFTSFAVSNIPNNHQYILYSDNCNSAQSYSINQLSSIANSWHSLIYTINQNSVCSLYFDGVFQGSYNGINFTNCSDTNTNLRFGGNWVTHDPQWFKGKIDDIGIWNRALTLQEITDLYSAQSCQVSLTTQPSNQTIGANRNAHFSVVSSEPNSTFRWQTNLGFGFQDLQNAGQYTGAQTSTLTVSNTSPQNDNQLFRCIVSTTHCGIDTSDVAILNVNSSSNSNSVPNKFNYQLVVRDTAGQLVSNRPVSMRLSLQRGPQMSNLYTETHQLTTNSNGLLTTTIGSGMPTHSSMDSLDWSLGDVFVKTEIDMNGGSNYSLVNTRELLSVPYALFSLNSGNSTPGPVGPMGPQGPAGGTGPQGPQGAPGQNAGPVFITPTNLFHKYGGWSNSWLDSIVVCDFDSILNLHPSSVIIQYQYVGNFLGNAQFFCKIDAATTGRIYNFCDIQNSISGNSYGSYADQIITEQVIIPVSSNGQVDFDFYAAGMHQIKLDLLGYFP